MCLGYLCLQTKFLLSNEIKGSSSVIKYITCKFYVSLSLCILTS
jgi:hypothetical protein